MITADTVTAYVPTLRWAKHILHADHTIEFRGPRASYRVSVLMVSQVHHHTLVSILREAVRRCGASVKLKLVERAITLTRRQAGATGDLEKL